MLNDQNKGLKKVIIQSDSLLLSQKKSNYLVKITFGSNQFHKVIKSEMVIQNLINQVVKIVPIYAVYGFVEMQRNNYLVVVTKIIQVGSINGAKIYQVDKVKFICASDSESQVDLVYINGMKNILQQKDMYFSEYDLTNSLKSVTYQNFGDQMENKRLQYFFNQRWIHPFLNIKAYDWITGFISGYVGISQLNSINCKLILISRRNKKRHGMRYLRRGCDLQGNSANTVQTQLIFKCSKDDSQIYFSYVQLRGSIPFLWNQNPDLCWSPKCFIIQKQNLNVNQEIFSKNYSYIRQYYQNITMINLIDSQGDQRMLGEYLQSLKKCFRTKTEKLIWFDFHKECSNMKYQNLGKLMDNINKQFQNYGYFEMQKKYNQMRGNIKHEQKGIFRTNCMDCLDRTNIVQSVIGRRMLILWLDKLCIKNKPSQIKAFQPLPINIQNIFRIQWVSNANNISNQYSGTPAMKTDFTGSGKRTYFGILADCYYSLKRYFLSNFYDSSKQDIIDFSLGKIVPKQNLNHQLRYSSVNSLYIVSTLFLIVPFLTFLIVNWLSSQQATILSKFLWTLIGTFFGSIFCFKILQNKSSMVIRRPISNNQNEQN